MMRVSIDPSGTAPAMAKILGAIGVALAIGLCPDAIASDRAVSESANVPRCLGERATLVVRDARAQGTEGDDAIVVDRRAGAAVDGRGGDDLICGGPGSDRLLGGQGKDRIEGGPGDDVLDGGPRRDRLSGGVGSDRLRRGRGDRLLGLGAGDRVNGRRQGNVLRRRAGTVVVPSGRVGPGTGRSRLVLDRGVGVPARGEIVVTPIGPDAPGGAIGRIDTVKRRPDGSHLLSLAPATLDEAYSRFSARTSGTLDQLAASSARAAGLKPTFSCKGSGAGPVVEVEVDLSKLHFTAEVDTWGPSIFVLLTGSPQFSLDFAFQGKVTCTASSAARIFIPVAGPVGVAIRPAFSFTVGGKLGGKFTWAPRLTVGFLRSRSSGNQDVTSFRNGGGVEVYGEASGEVFLGMKLEASLGGQVGLGGTIGPVLSARASFPSTGRVCLDVDGAGRAQLSASADVFFRDWSFSLFTVTFGRLPIAHSCTSGRDNTGGGGGGGPGGQGPGGGAVDPGFPVNGPYRQVAAGSHNSCAIQLDYTVTCRGDNTKVGDPPVGTGANEAPPGEFASISVGSYHVCGLRFSGEISCWGSDFYGESTPPAGPFTSVSVSQDYSCGVRIDHTISCWGQSPAVGSGLYSQIDAGFLSVCGLGLDQGILCWGSPPTGQFKEIAVGRLYACAIAVDDTIVCWGNDENGRATPPAGRFSHIASELGHSCAVAISGTMACWGDNDWGKATPPAGTFKQVSVSTNISCGLRTDGSAVCWGIRGSLW